MHRILFPGDKNYILKEEQSSIREELLHELVDFVKAYYLSVHNPLGLVDNTINAIQNSSFFPSEPFYEFYHDLSALYRYQFGEVQLEFLLTAGHTLKSTARNGGIFLWKKSLSSVKTAFLSALFSTFRCFIIMTG